MANTIAVRVPEDTRRKFVDLASKYGGTSYVMRELVQAFVENRIEIQAPKNPLYKENRNV